MKNSLIPLLFTLFAPTTVHSQDTFSFVAIDSVTGEVGSAGASCVNLFQTSYPNDDFIAELVPNVGAINTQAYYQPANQTNATNRMLLGETPGQIINWLIANDVQSQPQVRQYGIVAMVNGSPEAAAHTGASTDNYKNHILGPNYAIQGNILLGQLVLDSMESRFLNEPGDLACKLMAALQGANMIGADTRCSDDGTSSLFAYVKVAQPNDTFGNPSLLVSVRTTPNSGIEPIDSLQTKFDLVHSCNTNVLEETADFNQFFSVYPNPTSGYLMIQNKTERSYNLYLFDMLGKLLYQEPLNKTKTIDVSKYKGGTYFLKIANSENTFVKKLTIE